MKRISLDFDSTLADIHAVILPVLNWKHYGKGSTGLLKRPLEKADIIDWETLKEMGLNDDFYDLLTMFNTLKLRRAIPPVSPFAPAASKWLIKRGHEVEIVTANPINSVETMRAWAFGHGLDCPVRALGRVHAAEKLKLPFDLYIDDSPHLAAAMVDFPEKTMVLIDQPWNRKLDAVKTLKNVYRLMDWEEAADLFRYLGL